MVIDRTKMDDIYRIEYNYDNLGILKICKYLINVVINDVNYMDDSDNLLERQILDLGNNNIIKRKDLKSLVSIVDNTITDIINYNKE